ncbi:hypothetical protein HGRIS_002408 [Hohenbuehelia grisea]|uniref:Ankyrin repeat protein n=1 Tax=Hohenbuehelia grisea TaxID=104357 RepID=A0ABR3JKD7_9AGAR
MPVPLRSTNHRAEAKYNVSTDFPNYGLHAAAATGNIGLVEYALAHGQPINSVLDGVLPLHAASAGGDEQVVKLLLDYGADVNAPRLPRRYSNDKSRDASAPRVGNSGATPLHFAAANGNMNIVRMLLQRGAHPDRPDKHGITPESLARSEGWQDCADLLRNWALDKDKDLREREDRIPGPSQHQTDYVHSSPGRPMRDRLGSFGDPEPLGSQSTSGRKRLQVKRSIDNAFHMLKGSASDAHLRLHNPNTSPSPSSSRLNIRGTAFHTPPASPTKALGEYTFYPISPSEEFTRIDPSTRRPSLPHILSPTIPPARASIPENPRQASLKSPPIRQQSVSPSLRRPNSAGTDAERDDESLRQACRKLGSKYSLMSIFRKAQSTGEGTSAPDSTAPSMAGPRYSSSSVAPTSASTSGSNLSLTRSQSSLPPGSDFSSTPVSRTSFKNRAANELVSSSPVSISSRMRKTSSNLSQSPPQPMMSRLYHQNPVTSAVDLHNALAQSRHTPQAPVYQPSSPRHLHHRHTRDRSASAGSGTRFEQPSSLLLEEERAPVSAPPLVGVPGTVSSSPSHGAASPLARDVLRTRAGHRELPSTQSSSYGSANRDAAVYDPSLPELASSASKSNTDVPSRPPGPGILRAHSRSTSGQEVASSGSGRSLRFDPQSSQRVSNDEIPPSLTSVGLRASNSTGSLVTHGGPGSATRDPGSAPSTTTDFELGDQSPEVDDDEYEYGRLLMDKDATNALGLGALDAKASLPRSRGLSFASSSESSFSPTEADLARQSDGTINAALASEFPFSIHQPPPLLYDDTPEVGSLPQGGLSSNKASAQLGVPTSNDGRARGDSVSSASTGSSSQGPSTAISGPPGIVRTVEPEVYVEEVDAQDSMPIKVAIPSQKEAASILIPQGLGSRRSHTPVDINIASISTHAQAEALVQRAQRDILDIERETLDSGGLSADSTNGWTPLSARLAKYGESLALERKLREQKGAEQVATVAPAAQLSEAGRPLASQAHPVTRQDAGVVDGQRSEVPERAGVERQLSLEHKSGEHRARFRTKQPRRPHTSDGPSEVSRVRGSFAAERGKTHQSSHSASVLDSRPRALSIDGDLESPDRDQRLRSAPAASHQDTRPDPEYSADELSFSGFLDTDGEGLSNGKSVAMGAASPRLRRDQPRDVARATKLTRMGFDAAATRPPQPPKRFGGLKSLMQSFKGK